VQPKYVVHRLSQQAQPASYLGELVFQRCGAPTFLLAGSNRMQFPLASFEVAFTTRKRELVAVCFARARDECLTLFGSVLPPL